jgi:hypothetical protein
MGVPLDLGDPLIDLMTAAWVAMPWTPTRSDPAAVPLPAVAAVLAA